jgi:hypothetical protein
MAEELSTRKILSVTDRTSEKAYAEVVFDAIVSPGISPRIAVGIVPSGGSGIWISTLGFIWVNVQPNDTVTEVDGPTFTAGNVAMFAVDCPTGKVWVGKVGTGWYNSGDPAAGTGQTGTLSVLASNKVSAILMSAEIEPIGGSQFSLRTQSSQFTGTIPSGFSAWYP